MAKNQVLKLNVSGGFTLIEALVALLVLAFGLLGVAAMQLKALQSAHVSYQRSIAAIAAQDAEERLWVELGEHSRICPFKDAAALEGGPGLEHLNEWANAWSPYFNQLEIDSSLGASSDDECGYRILLGWNDERFVGEDVSNLVFLAKLPGL